MFSFFNWLGAQSMRITVDTTLRDGGFYLTYPGLLGDIAKTNAATTQRILQSPDFDSLFAAEKAVRILTIALAAGTEAPTP